VFVWAEDFPSGEWGELRVAFEEPSNVEFECLEQEGFEVYVDASIAFGPLRLSLARLPHRHLIARRRGIASPSGY
jgi:hypothetical protein